MRYTEHGKVDVKMAKVIYIEDNMANIRLMESLFNKIPHAELVISETAEGGLIKIDESMPDLVLMDINLPGINGIEALRQLRQNPNTAHLPVIAVTAGAMQENIDALKEAGFTDYVTKPFDVIDVIRMIEEQLRH